jgi:peptidoglycan hydrolase-like protein with peptidoglycan-binding domain
MVTANDVLNVAKSQLGYVEGKNNHTKYGEWYGIDNAPWCATFVSWCFAQAGQPLPAIQHAKGYAYCPSGVNYFKKIGQYHKTPKVGDIVFFDWRADGVSDHTGLVLEIKNSQQIITIEGNTSFSNQSNGGQVMQRSRMVQHCCGFGRPSYDQNSIVSNQHLFDGRYLRLCTPNMQGENIKLVQLGLKRHGYSIDADGVFGDQTHIAVKGFQQAKNLEIDGIVGTQTWQKLFASAS